MKWEYIQPVTIRFGEGIVKEVKDVAASMGCKRGILVSDPFFLTNGLADKIVKDSDGTLVCVYGEVSPNPEVKEVDACAKLIRENDIEFVVALGGGSALDCAKASATMCFREGESVRTYHGTGVPMPQKHLPLIAVPTTAGTGSQVTQVAVMTETKTCTKSAIFNNLIYPRVALIDPELAVSMPAHITASTGFDAFCHCFESYINVKASPYTDMIALEGIKYAAQYLRRAVKDGEDMEAREGMAWADTCGGLAIANAGVTLPHGVGMTISGHCPQIMHGESLALTYPSFLRFTCLAAEK